jgi:protein FAM50
LRRLAADQVSSIKKKRKKTASDAPRKRTTKLSFEDDEIEVPMPRLAKDPTANTSFLPDRDREEADRLERERLRKEWVAEQDRIRSEPIEIVYSYWDGSGHRKTIEVGLCTLTR